MTELNRVATTKERLEIAMRETGKKQTDLAHETGLNKSIISRCVNGLVDPDQVTVFKLARALNVSEMWLWGYDVPKERTLEQKKNDDLAKIIAKMRKNPELIDFVSMALELSPEQFSSMKQILSGLVNK